MWDKNEQNLGGERQGEGGIFTFSFPMLFKAITKNVILCPILPECLSIMGWIGKKIQIKNNKE